MSIELQIAAHQQDGVLQSLPTHCAQNSRKTRGTKIYPQQAGSCLKSTKKDVSVLSTPHTSTTHVHTSTQIPRGQDGIA